MLPPPRRGSDSMEIVCKLRHTRGVMPSWGFRHPLRKREGDKKTTTHLKSYGYNLPVGTANLGVGDLGCAPVGTRKDKTRFDGLDFAHLFRGRTCLSIRPASWSCRSPTQAWPRHNCLSTGHACYSWRRSEQPGCTTERRRHEPQGELIYIKLSTTARPISAPLGILRSFFFLLFFSFFFTFLPTLIPPGTLCRSCLGLHSLFGIVRQRTTPASVRLVRTSRGSAVSSQQASEACHPIALPTPVGPEGSQKKKHLANDQL